MFDQTTTRAFTRASYTLDLPGLSAHAFDTLAAYARRAVSALSAHGPELPRNRVGPCGRNHAEYHVPDSIRVR